jgi:protein-disulfide isomerase
MDTPTSNTTEQAPMHPNHVLAIAILLGAVMISGALLYNIDRPDTSGTANVGQKTIPTEPPSNAEVEINSDDHVLGDPNAPITIVEFSDFQCPFCRSFYKDTYQQIKDNYVDSGDARIIYKHFPLPFHPAAAISAQASECASEQDLFWEMHDKIFDEQIPFGNGTIEYGETELKKWASEIGVDTDQFNQCLDSGKYDSLVSDNEAHGTTLGVSGTPTVFINGQRIVGAQPYSVFEQIIESELLNRD